MSILQLVTSINQPMLQRPRLNAQTSASILCSFTQSMNIDEGVDLNQDL